MNAHEEGDCIAFAGDRRIARGTLLEVALATKAVADRGGPDRILVFEARTGRPVELDLRGTPDQLAARIAEREEGAGGAQGGATADAAAPPEGRSPRPRRGPGRPKLGVVSKEVTLLPRHWAWLGAQRGGASATLRRLVDRARKENEGRDRVRRAQDAAYRFMSATVGDRPGFEEATRALFAGDRIRFHEESEAWPPDLREHCRRLAAEALGGTEPPEGTADGGASEAPGASGADA